MRKKSKDSIIIGLALLSILAVTISGGSLKTLTSKVNNKFLFYQFIY